MRLFRQLTEKPWENPGLPALATGSGGLRLPAPRIGLRVFLCVVAVLFSLLVAAYAERMAYEDWRPAPPTSLLWINTLLLIASSIAFQWALTAIRRGRIEETKLGLLAAGGLAVAFLVGQFLAWQQLESFILYDITNPAIAFFYLITALHGLHLLGGLVAWGRAVVRLWRHPGSTRAAMLVRLCATYWHFLLALWLILFALLFSGNDNLTFLLALCGLR